MEVFRANSVDAFIVPKMPPPVSEVAPVAASPVDPAGAPTAPLNQDSATVGGGKNSELELAGWNIKEQVARTLAKAARGEMDFDLGLTTPQAPKPQAPAGNSGWPQGVQSAEQGNAQVAGNSGWGAGQGTVDESNGPGDGAGDPLVFDLNSDGDTNATVDQHGIDVDGLKHTKWAEKGDGVLAMGDEPLDTEGGKYKDAFENLRDKAAQAGIDVSKGYLDKADLQKLEEQGLTMLVSNGDGTNQAMRPTELGITQMSLGGQKVDQRDSAGNRITEQGSFVRNGKTDIVNDMWFNEI